MNTALLQVSRQIKYRALDGLIGRQVVISSAASVPAEVAHQLRSDLPPGLHFQGPEPNYVTLALAKYGILDLSFTIEEFHWGSADSPGVPLLEEFGFVLREPTPSESPTLFDDKDPTCLEQLQDDINENKTVVKLFLEERPKRDLKASFLAMASSGKMESVSAGGVDSLDHYFPKMFEVVDACLTNADFIWFHRYFYL